jgi:TonB family protein
MLLRPAIFFPLLAASWTCVSALDARLPTRGWVVNFDDAQCVAFRDYGTAEVPIQLILKTPPIGGVVQLAVARKGSPIIAAQVKGTLALDDRAPTNISMLAYSPKGSGLRIYMMNVPSAEFALVRQAKELTIQAGGNSENFLLNGMPPMLKAVDDCVLDLRRVFNVTDPETAEKSPLKRRASGNLGRLFQSEDYPIDALDRSQGGKLRYALLIDESGRVADCTIVETSGVAALDAQACILLKTRARFRNALGADGKPAKDAVAGNFIWTVK